MRGGRRGRPRKVVVEKRTSPAALGVQVSSQSVEAIDGSRALTILGNWKNAVANAPSLTSPGIDSVRFVDMVRRGDAIIVEHRSMVDNRDSAFGVIASQDSNITYDSSGEFLLSPALEKVGVWHVRQGVCTEHSLLHPPLAVPLSPSPPSPLLLSLRYAGHPLSNSSYFEVFYLFELIDDLVKPVLALRVASGYANGSVRIWELDTATCETTLNGHKGSVARASVQ
ncbi:Dip2/Utp12 protein [Dionaea muscipula]